MYIAYAVAGQCHSTCERQHGAADIGGVLAMQHGAQGEYKGGGPGKRDIAVHGQRAAGGTTQTQGEGIHAHHGGAGALHFLRVGGLEDIAGGVGQGGEVEVLVRFGGDDEADAAIIGDGNPLGVHAVTHFHGEGVALHHVFHGGIPDADVGAGLAVGVVFAGSAAIPAHIGEALGQHEGVAQFGQHYLVHAGDDTGLHAYVAVGQDGVHQLGGELEVLFGHGPEVLHLVGALIVLTAVEVLLAGALAGHIAGDTHHTVVQTLHKQGGGGVYQVAEAVVEPLVHGPLVIGYGGAEGVQVHGGLLAQQLLAVHDVVLDAAGGLVHAEGEVRPDNEHLAALVAHVNLGVAELHEVLAGIVAGHCLGQFHLLGGYHVALVGPVSLLLEAEVHGEEVAAVLAQGEQLLSGERQGDLLRGKRSSGGGESAFGHYLAALFHEGPRTIVFSQVGEEVLVADADAQPLVGNGTQGE